MTGAVLLDLVLVGLLAVYAWSGWRQGFLSAVLGLVGLVGGGFLALRFVPEWLEEQALYPSTTAGALALVLVVLASAALGQGLMLLLARRLRESVRAPSARAVDAALGLVAVLVASVLVLWVVAGAVRVGGPPGARALLARSAVVTAVDEVVPPSAGRLVEEVTSALDGGVFPRVFEGLGPEPISPVAPPDTALAEDPDIARALRSVVHVRAESETCDQAQVGSGWVVASGRVATNAHVVAGSDSVNVSVQGTGRQREARVVAFDPRRDVAILDVPGLDAPRLPAGAALSSGDPAVVAGFPGDDGFGSAAPGCAAPSPPVVPTSTGVRGSCARSTRCGRRCVGEPREAPCSTRTGAWWEWVFATSLDDPDTGYALTLREISPVVRLASSSAVSTGTCVAG